MAIFISRLWTQPILITAMLASLVNITGCAKKAEQQEAKPQETTTLNIGFQKYGIFDQFFQTLSSLNQISFRLNKVFL